MPFSDLTHLFVDVIQERKWLSKSGGASSNIAAMASPSILPKGGGAIAPLAPPTVTPLIH